MDIPTGPRVPRSTVLSVEEEAVIAAFRKHTLLPFDDGHFKIDSAFKGHTLAVVVVQTLLSIGKSKKHCLKKVTFLELFRWISMTSEVSLARNAMMRFQRCLITQRR